MARLPLEVFCFALEMEQIKEEKCYKKPISMVPAVIKVTDSPAWELEEHEQINLEALEEEELNMTIAVQFQ